MGDIETLVRLKYDLPTIRSSYNDDKQVFTTYPEVVIKNSILRILNYIADHGAFGRFTREYLEYAKSCMVGEYRKDSMYAVRFNEIMHDLRDAEIVACWTAHCVSVDGTWGERLAMMIGEVQGGHNFNDTINEYAMIIFEELCKWEMSQ